MVFGLGRRNSYTDLTKRNSNENLEEEFEEFKRERAKKTKEGRFLRTARRGMQAEELATLPTSPAVRRKIQEIEFQQRRKLTPQERTKILRRAETARRAGISLREFGRAAPQDFTFQEQVIKQTIGGQGEKIWGTKMQPVEMNHDLNPRQRGDTETAEMFGFG